MRGVDGMIEDQHDYVLRQAKEREKEQSGDAQALEEITSDPDYLDDVFEDEEPSEEDL